jgi:hypothetical protein
MRADLSGAQDGRGSCQGGVRLVGWLVLVWVATTASHCAEPNTPSPGDSRAPKVKITAPVGQTSLSWNAGAKAGQNLIANVTTQVDPFVPASLSWVIRPKGVANAQPTTASGNNVTLPPLNFIGLTTITARYTDAYGPGQDQIDVTITNTPPTPHITYPSEGAIFHKGQTITCRGSADDPDDDVPDGQLSWIMNAPDGTKQLGTGRQVPASLTAVGSVLLELIADDAHGASGNAQVHFIVDSGTGFPSVKIINPTDGQAFTAGTPVTFVATGLGANGASLPDSQLQWSSDKDGPLGTGSTIQKTLTSGSPAIHVITLTATDPQTGNSATDKVTITVNDRVL